MKVKFLTLNLFEGGLLFENILDFLRAEKPDVLALQEVYDGRDRGLAPNFRSIQVLKKELEGYYHHFAPELLDNRDGGKIGFGNAVFSKFPIVSSGVVFFDVPFDEHYVKAERQGDFSKDPKNLQRVGLDVGGLVLNVFNIHGIWGLDGRDSPGRLRMSETIVEQIKGKEKVVLAGDFNLKPDTRTIGNIEQYLRNVFKGELVSSFNMKRKSSHKTGYATSVVDMVFVSPDVKVLDHYCPRVDVSDHLPLICLLD